MYLPAVLLGAALLLGALVPDAAAAADDDAGELATLLTRPVYGGSRLTAASKHDEDLAGAPGAAVVRTGGEIRAQGWRTLGEVLESMPGVHLRYDGVYSYAGLRGATRPGDYSSHLLVLVDGVRVNDALYESPPIDRDFPVDVTLIDRVEFIPGPGSALYGSSAVAGVVNVVTRQPSQLPGAQFALGIGSQRARRATATWGGSAGDTRVLFGWAAERRPGGDRYYPAYDSPATNRGVAAGRDAERSDKLYLKLQREGLRVSLALSQRRKDVPTGGYDATFDMPMPWLDGYVLLAGTYTRALSPDVTLDATLGYHRYAFDSRGLYGDAGETWSRARDDARWWNGELRLHWTGFAGHRVTLGWEGQLNTRQHIAVMTVVGTDRQEDRFAGRSSRQGFYASDEWRLRPSLTLIGGLRHDHRTDGSAGWSPRLAAVWQAAPALTLKWIAATAYREPNFSELEYEDSVQRKPEGLRVESLRSNELVARWQPTPAWTLQASAYRARMRDVSELAARDDGLLAYANRGGVRSHGVAAELTHVTPGGVQWRASWSLDDARDAGTATTMTNVPRGLVKLSLTTPLSPPGLTLGVGAVGMGRRGTLAGHEVGTTVRVDTRIGYAPPDRAWELSLAVKNLLDRRISDPAGPEHRQDTLPQDGCQAMLGLQWRY